MSSPEEEYKELTDSEKNQIILKNFEEGKYEFTTYASTDELFEDLGI